MIKGSEKWRDVLSWLPTLVVAVMLFGGAYFVDRLNFESWHDQERVEVMKDLSLLKAQLEGKLYSNLQTVEGMVAAISVEPDMRQERFAEFARPLFSRRTQLRNLSAAPNMVVSMVYPLAGNEKALGLDFMKVPAQRDSALDAKESGQVVVAGPVHLVQGGVGFIGRIPVVIAMSEGQPAHFWGLLSAVIDTHKLYEAAGLLEPSLNVNLAIRGKDGLGEAGEVFFGEPLIFQQDPELATVPLPSGKWIMAAVPKGGWSTVAPNAARLRFTLFCLSTFILAVLALFNLAQKKRLLQEKAMRSLFELSPIGIALNDDQSGRFVSVNQALMARSGYSRNEFMLQDLSLIQLTGNPEIEPDLLNKIKHEKKLGPLDITFLRRDGTRYPALFSAMTIKDISGRDYIWSMIQDISEQKAAQQAVEASQREFKNFFDLSLVLMCITTANGRFEKINSAFTRVLGYSQADLLASPFIDFVHPDDREATGSEFSGLLKGETRVSFTNRYRCADGRYKSLMWNTVPDPRGGRFYAVAVDISQQIANEQEIVRAHAELSNQMRLLEAIAAVQSSAIGEQDSHKIFDDLLQQLLRLTDSAFGFIGEIIYPEEGEPFLRSYAISNLAWNPEMQRLYADSLGKGLEFRNLESLFGHAVRHLQPVIANSPASDPRRAGLPPGHPALDAFMGLPIVRNGRGVAMVGLANRPGGYNDDQVKWLEPMLMSIGQLVENLRMKAERERVQAELIQAKNAAEDAARAKSEFLAVMSHEIRTPMNGVIGMLNLLLGSPLSDSQKHKLNVAKTSADALLDIINDILDFSRIDAGKMEFEYIDTDLPDLLGSLIESFALKAQEKNLELILDMSPLSRRFIKTDPGRLRQILNNLLGNAVKFTGAGEITLRCGVQESEQGLQLQVMVKDSGIGIPQDKIPLLFSPFTQVDASTTRKYGGTGLGLAICKQLCSKMKGEISVRSEERVGSEFHFMLPVLASARNDSMRPDMDVSAVSVVIIEQHQQAAANLQRQLQAWGIRRVQTWLDSASLATALQNAEPIPFADANLFLIDERLYLSLLRDAVLFARWKEATQGKAVVLMTAMANLARQAQSQKDHIAAAVPKPMTWADYCVAFNSLRCSFGSELRESIRHSEQGIIVHPFPVDTRVLLAEDNRINQEVLSLLLEDTPVQLDIANDGAEALAMLSAASDHHRPYHAVLMDCQMPNIDGYEATRLIREGKAGLAQCHIPIIALTANALKTDEEKCLAAGMSDYLVKPIDEAALLEKLSLWIRQSR